MLFRSREKAEQTIAELRELRHMVEKFQAKEAAGETERFLMGGHTVGDLKVLTATVPNADAAKLRQMGDMLRDKQPNVVAVLSAVNDGKITFLAVCGKEAVSKEMCIRDRLCPSRPGPAGGPEFHPARAEVNSARGKGLPPAKQIGRAHV